MELVFFSNYLNHHQVLLADELYDQSNYEYVFVATTDIPEFRRKLGYADYSDRPYLLKAYEGDEKWEKAMQLSREADVALFGGGLAIEFQKERLKENNKLSFEVSERWLKRGLLNLLSPRLLKNMWYYHTQWKNRPLYKLCSSAFTAGDQYKLHSFKGRCYKWGYFTRVPDINVDSICTQSQETVRLMWCARFIDWKHPELAIEVAARLKAKGVLFVLDMYGNGERLDLIKTLANKLGVDDYVNFCGSTTNDGILEAMQKHDIFLFTSDRQEGWGAVLNEAMCSGCAVVASNAIGSAPYLIKDGENGMVFLSEELDSLLEKVVFLIEHPDKRMQIAKNAYLTMRDLWSPKTAARNLLQLIDDLQHGRDTSIEEGPCSKALPL